MPKPSLLVTEQFEQDYYAAGPRMKQLIRSEVAHLRNRIAAEPKTWLHRLDTVEGLDERVVEVEVSGGPRMLAVVDGAAPILWRVGRHEVVSEVVRNRPRVPSRKDGRPLPSEFEAAGLLPATAGENIEQWVKEEGLATWLYFLSDAQTVTAKALADASLDAVLGGDSYTALVGGGPGTGKTAILVWLLDTLHGLLVSEGKRIVLRCSEPLLRYVKSGLPWDVTDAWIDPTRPVPWDADVVLIDDPATLKDLRSEITNARKQGRARSVIIAVDPLQCTHAISDDEFEAFVKQVRAEEHWLRVSYRQKEEVGVAARQVMRTVAESSPFLDATKVTNFRDARKRLTAAVNDIEFANPTGRVINCPEPSWDDFPNYVRMLRLQQKDGLLWTHWPPILVIVDPDSMVPEAFAKPLEEMGAQVMDLSEMEQIKGLEYQHVALFLAADTYRSVNEGFVGSGQQKHNWYRRLRIPFTRARDSLAIFVVNRQSAP